jgi:hypothetical protein
MITDNKVEDYVLSEPDKWSENNGETNFLNLQLTFLTL